MNARSRTAATAASSAASAKPVAAPVPARPDELDLDLRAEAVDGGAEAGASRVGAAGPQTNLYTGPVGSAKTARPTAADCADPFTVDANGIKRPKPQCFGTR